MIISKNLMIIDSYLSLILLCHVSVVCVNVGMAAHFFTKYLKI